VETPVQDPQPKAKRLTDAAIAKALGVSASTFCVWRKEGCPNTSLEAAQAWKTARVRKPLKNQARPGNRNGEGKALEKRIAKWNLPAPRLKTNLTPELLSQVAACFVDGFNDVETGILCDVHPDSIRKWRKLNILKKAELARKQSLIQRITDSSQRDWTRWAWFLERRFPLEFSRPEVAHAIATANVTQNNLTQNLIISADIAKQLSRRSAAVEKTVRELFANRVTPASDRPAKLPDRGAQPEDDLE
jgi:hypothetical protein